MNPALIFVGLAKHHLLLSNSSFWSYIALYIYVFIHLVELVCILLLALEQHTEPPVNFITQLKIIMTPPNGFENWDSNCPRSENETSKPFNWKTILTRFYKLYKPPGRSILFHKVIVRIMRYWDLFFLFFYGFG